MATKNHDNFLADAVGSKIKHISYQDGFRFGVGFFVGTVAMAVVLGGLTWGLTLLLHVH
jgi:hypothetical protein